MDGILSDTAIRAAVEAGDIEIDPFTEQQLNITSYDLTLGSEVRVYKRWVRGTPQELLLSQGQAAAESAKDGSFLESDKLGSRAGRILDSHTEPLTEAWTFDEQGFVLKPGIGYLMHTKERVKTNKFNPILDGKSSIGRLFLQVHATAGYGDPGFDGQYTLEVIAQHPVRVYPGMRICQIRFHTIVGELGKTYDQVGHYTKAAAKGAVASQAWKQFRSVETK